MEQTNPPIISLGHGRYFVYTGLLSTLREYFHSPEGKDYLRANLAAGKVIRIWCPEDRDAVYTIQRKNVGTRKGEGKGNGNSKGNSSGN